jgi:hypothetical protein
LPVDYVKRPIEEHILDFDEVTLGFDPVTAAMEASRCMHCPDPQPCTLRCPAGNDVPQALWLISQGDFIGAAQVFAATNVPLEVLPADQRERPRVGRRVAIIGGGDMMWTVRALPSGWAPKR